MYQIHYCWNGSERQVAFTVEFDSKREWEFEIEGMPYDILDESSTECWVDYGDNDLEPFQMHELEALLGNFAGDFDVDGIVDECTAVYSDGNRYWKDLTTDEMNAIIEKHEK